MFFQYLTYVLGGIAAYRLWEEITWLSILVAVFAVSYGVHEDEKMQHQVTGEYSTPTATRLMWTCVIVAAIFVYSLVA